jgi:hypothetical protein
MTHLRRTRFSPVLMNLSRPIRRWHASLLVGVVLLSVGACGEAPLQTRPRVYVGFPEIIDSRCREGKARIFDECGDQSALFTAALARSKREGKVLLVEFGAEWCIWCQVFDAHINGEHNTFRYTYGSPEEPEARYTHTLHEEASADIELADRLREFVAANFVIAHIDAQYAPHGEAVLADSGAAEHFPGGIPFVFTVDDDGRFAASFDDDAAEKRREGVTDWYRGYDRSSLIRQLTAMRDAAREGAKKTAKRVVAE